MNFEIPKLKWLKAVSLAAAKNDIRYYINGIVVRNGELAATNGSIVLLIKSEKIKSDGEYIIDNDTLKMIVASKKGIKGDSRIEVEDGAFIIGGNKIFIAPLDGKFPDVNRVIPQETSGEIAHFNYEYLLTCQKANGEFLGGKRPWIKLQHNGRDGSKFESEDEEGNKLVGVVMPIRI